MFMNWLNSFYYIIPAVFIILIVFPFYVEVRVSYNPIFNRGVIAMFLFKKKIFYYLISIKRAGIELRNESETKLKKLEFSSPEFVFVEEFGNQLKDKVRLKKLNVFYHIGTGDAFSSSVLCGVINQIFLQFFLYLKSKKPTASLCVYDTVAYNKEVFEMVAVASVSVSLFDVAYSYLYSVIISNNRK